MRQPKARQALLDTLVNMSTLGLSAGTTGNVSVRVADGFLISPSAMRSEHCTPDDMVLLGLDGSVTESQRKPSSEWRVHADIYRQRADAKAVVHTHSPACTALACLRREIPAFHYMVALGGGSNIRCADYETFGTEALSATVLDALRERTACLMANHGMVCLADDLVSALHLASDIETLAGIYLMALQAGEPALLSAAQMEAVLSKFDTYRTANQAEH